MILLKLAVVLCLFVGSAFALDCTRNAGSLPEPLLKQGEPNPTIPIEHIVVIMQENHSFDNYFGHLNQPQFYGSEVDGVTSSMFNPDKSGKHVSVFKEQSLCIKDPAHNWAAMHNDWNNGKNDGFVKQNDARVMGTYDQTDIPYYYALANQFAIADRYFSAGMTQTFPNRFFLLAGTPFGHIKNDKPSGPSQFSQKTLFDVLTDNKISWRYYTDDQGYLQLFQPMYKRNIDKMKTIADYEADVMSSNFPQVVFIDAAFDGGDEHPAADIQLGEDWTAGRINKLILSPNWKNSVLFLTYDEAGGFFDHVSPPEACEPDNLSPRYKFDHDGFRVPFVAISPFAKHHYVSHVTHDHTSILKFIETKFNLPALSKRDANADGLLDMFDFEHPQFEVTALPDSTPDPNRRCGP